MGDSPATRAQWRFPGALSAAVLLCVLFAVLLGSPLKHSVREAVSYTGFALGGALIMVSGALVARRCRGGRRRAWWLLTSAAAVAVVGNVWVAAQGSDRSDAPGFVA